MADPQCAVSAVCCVLPSLAEQRSIVRCRRDHGVVELSSSVVPHPHPPNDFGSTPPIAAAESSTVTANTVNQLALVSRRPYNVYVPFTPVEPNFTSEWSQNESAKDDDTPQASIRCSPPRKRRWSHFRPKLWQPRKKSSPAPITLPRSGMTTRGRRRVWTEDNKEGSAIVEEEVEDADCEYDAGPESGEEGEEEIVSFHRAPRRARRADISWMAPDLQSRVFFTAGVESAEDLMLEDEDEPFIKMERPTRNVAPPKWANSPVQLRPERRRLPPVAQSSPAVKAERAIKIERIVKPGRKQT